MYEGKCCIRTRKIIIYLCVIFLARSILRVEITDITFLMRDKSRQSREPVICMIYETTCLVPVLSPRLCRIYKLELRHHRFGAANIRNN